MLFKHSETNKPPVAPASASKQELKEMAQRAGWKIRALTFDEVQNMSSSELRFHEVWNAEALNRAFELEVNRRHNAERDSIWNVRRKWREGVSQTEHDLARRAGEQFALRTPTFARTLNNALKIVKWLEGHDQDATDVRGYFQAWQELTAAGELELVKPQSADEFLSEHPELRDRRTPPLIEARHAKVENTQKFIFTRSGYEKPKDKTV